MSTEQTADEAGVAGDPPGETRRGRAALRWMLRALAALLWIWTCGALHYLAKMPAPLALALVVAPPVARWRWPLLRHAVTASAVVLFLWMVIVFVFLTKPQTIRDWWEGNLRPPVVRYDGQMEFFPEVGAVGVQNVRHFKWRTRDDFEPSWVFETYFLDQLDSLDLVIEPLGDSNRFAHTMLSFGFGPVRRVVISVEARREKGERFGLIPGLYKQFELFYQINSERDAFTRRVLSPDSHLYVYPVKASPEFIRGLFLDLIQDAARLVDQPEFYHSLKANCTTKLFEHVNRNLDEPIRYTREILFPSRAGRLLHELGWMDTELDYPAAKERFRLADKVREFAEHPDFSTKIRQ